MAQRQEYAEGIVIVVHSSGERSRCQLPSLWTLQRLANSQIRALQKGYNHHQTFPWYLQLLTHPFLSRDPPTIQRSFVAR